MSTVPREKGGDKIRGKIRSFIRIVSPGVNKRMLKYYKGSRSISPLPKNFGKSKRRLL